MCTGFFFGMPWMWFGGFFGIGSLVLLSLGGAYWLGHRTKQPK